MHASFLTQSWCSLFLSLGQMEWFLRLKKGKSLEDWGSSFFFFHFYNIVLVFAIQQHKSAMIMYTPTPSPASPLLPHPTPPGHHRAPDQAPCATQQLFTSYPSHTGSCVYVDAAAAVAKSLQSCLTLCDPIGYCPHLSHSLPPLCSQDHPLHLCLFSFLLFINIIFLDSIYTH